MLPPPIDSLGLLTMNALTALPFEIQDYIYEFDGRYKTAMKKTLYLIEEWGKTTVNGEFSWSTKSPFILEADRRAKMYSRHLGDDNVIRLRHAVIDARIKGVQYYHMFKDVLGAYAIMAKKRSILAGEEYNSTNYYKYVGTLGYITRDELKNATGTTTRETRFYLLDPDVQKELRQSKNPNAFLDHGLSPKGKRSKIVFKHR